MPAAARDRCIRLSLEGARSPPRALALLRGLSGRVLLESCGGGGRSLLSAEPRRILRWPGPGAGGDDPLRALARLLPSDSAARRTEGLFAGGWIGYLGYETADMLERLPPPPARRRGEPPAVWLGLYDWAVVWGPDGAPPRLEGAVLPGGDAAELRTRMEGVRRRLEEGAFFPVERAPDGAPPRMESSLGREGFLRGVERIREYIRAGDLFQANLTHQLSGAWKEGGEVLYARLRERSPAAYAAYLDTGEGEVASISPEEFLSLRGRRVRTRPIKGTAPRSADSQADAALAAALAASEKDRAENVMIVDLLRNDLSRVCRPGTVQVPRMLSLESHPTVHHLVSTVEGELEPGAGAVDLLRAALPGGSITGAPKIRAIEVLRELEPVRRGVYTGALGLLELGGDLELSIAIRTAVVGGGRASYGTGGGITLDSDPEAEWDETLDKAAPFLAALGAEAPAVEDPVRAAAAPAGPVTRKRLAEVRR